MGFRKHYQLSPNIRTWSANLSQHAGNVAAFCQNLGGDLEETEQTLSRRPLVDCFVHTDDIRFHVTPESEVVLHARDKQDRENRLSLSPTPNALRQIVRRVGLGSLRLYDLLAERNPHLLAENLNFLTRNLRPQEFLFRLYGEKVRPHDEQVLRAFLLPAFSTNMDNIHLCRALREVLSERFISDNGIEGVYIHCATGHGGEMLVDIMLPKKKMTVLGEQYQSGLRLRASEVGHYRGVTVAVLVTRLICNNGMSATFDDKRAFISYYDKSLGCHNLARKVDAAVYAGMEGIQKTRDDYESRVNRLIGDAGKNPETFDDNDVRTALAFIIQRSAMGAAGGISIHDVVDAYKEERSRRPKTDTAWLLVNAFTRYATHYLLQKQNNLHLAQIVQASVFETMLNPRRMTWDIIVEEVLKKRAKADESPEHDEGEY